MKLIPMTLIVLLLSTPAFAVKNKDKKTSKKTETHKMMKKEKKSKMKHQKERVPASKEAQTNGSLTDTHFLIYE